MLGGWNKEHFESCRTLACLLIDLSRAQASCFCSRGFHGLTPRASENCFFLRKGSLEVAAKEMLMGSLGGWGAGGVLEAGRTHICWGDGQRLPVRQSLDLIHPHSREGSGKDLFQQGLMERGVWMPEARHILGIKLDHSKDSPGLKVARHWGRFPRETVARNTICQRWFSSRRGKGKNKMVFSVLVHLGSVHSG